MSSANQLKDKNIRRLRRRRHIRRSVFGCAEKPRMTIFRSHKNISCQVIDDYRGVTLVSASTQGKDLRPNLKGGGNCKAAEAVGRTIAEKIKALGIASVSFDRNGYRFHGRVKALVEAARQAGLKV